MVAMVRHATVVVRRKVSQLKRRVQRNHAVPARSASRRPARRDRVVGRALVAGIVAAAVTAAVTGPIAVLHASS